MKCYFYTKLSFFNNYRLLLIFSTDLQIMNQESETPPVQNATISETDLKEKGSVSKKPRKEYEWTPKRKEAFEKMRKGLEEKVNLTKRLKEEKRRAEKDAIKAKVKEIMNSKKGPVVTQESDSESNDSSSEEEMPAQRKKTQKEQKKAIAVKEAKTSSKRKKAREVSSEEEQEAASDSSSEEEAPRRQQNHLTAKQHQHYMKDKVERGKAVKASPFINPLDQFILL